CRRVLLRETGAGRPERRCGKGAGSAADRSWEGFAPQMRKKRRSLIFLQGRAGGKLTAGRGLSGRRSHCVLPGRSAPAQASEKAATLGCVAAGPVVAERDHIAGGEAGVDEVDDLADRHAAGGG